MSDSSSRMTSWVRWEVDTPRDDDGGLPIAAKRTARKLPEEILENIISRFPFPSLFQARVLSRTWYFKFPLASQLTRSVASSLQNQVTSVSSKWPTYCPVLFSKVAFIGFDRVSSRWQTLMNISQVPSSTWSSITCNGPLICFVRYPRNFDVFVTNALTRCWRKLDFPLHHGEPIHVKIILMASDAYKVLIVFRGQGWLCSQVYDSRLRTCKTKPLFSTVGSRFLCSNGTQLVDIECYPNYPASAYLGGTLYCIFGHGPVMGIASLWKYDIEINEWTRILQPTLHNVADCGVLLCGGKIMVVACCYGDEEDEEDEDHLSTPEDSIRIYELDIVGLKLQLVATGPPEVIFGVDVRSGGINFASDAKFIYLGHTIPSSPVLTCNILSNEWDCLPPPGYTMLGSVTGTSSWMGAPFEPGLNPFIMA